MSGKDEMLDKAIAEAKEAEDWQLVEWLRAARGSESATRWYSGKLRDANRVKRKLLNENAKLRVLAARMAKALDVNSMWCNADCKREFNCNMSDCPIDAALRELGIEVDS